MRERYITVDVMLESPTSLGAPARPHRIAGVSIRVAIAEDNALLRDGLAADRVHRRTRASWNRATTTSC